MCGRFYIDDETSKEIQQILKKLDENLKPKIKTGEVFPTDTTLALKARNDTIIPTALLWGFPNFKNKGVIINARSETAFEKMTFRESLLNRRCIIPASGFYEWNKDKDKIYFYKPSSILYMAGIYNRYQGEDRYVILTTAANSCMIDVHNRMPLLLNEKELEQWLLDDSVIQSMLHYIPHDLQRIVVC